MKIKRLTFLSDTHTMHDLIPQESLGSGDIIFHSGDFTYRGDNDEVESFLMWFASLDYTYKVFIAGNHEIGFEENMFIVPDEYKNKGVIYLQDEFIILEGLKIYGSPWQPYFGGWEFNLPRMGKELEEKWSLIPKDVDILLTHSPVYSYLDLNMERIPCGCELLYKRVTEIEPWIHAWGHIHEAYGQKSIDNREMLNVSIVDRSYRVAHRPVKLEVNIETKTLKYI